MILNKRSAGSSWHWTSAKKDFWVSTWQQRWMCNNSHGDDNSSATLCWEEVRWRVTRLPFFTLYLNMMQRNTFKTLISLSSHESFFTYDLSVQLDSEHNWSDLQLKFRLTMTSCQTYQFEQYLTSMWKKFYYIWCSCRLKNDSSINTFSSTFLYKSPTGKMMTEHLLYPKTQNSSFFRHGC